MFTWILSQEGVIDNAWMRLFLQTGGMGVVAWIMYTIAKRFMDETVKQMSARIEAAEKRLDACEQDRANLHKEFSELLLKLSQCLNDREP